MEPPAAALTEAPPTGKTVEQGIRFTSALPPQYQEELEGLMFFHPQQKKNLAGINHSIKDFGVPSVFVDGERLRVRIEGLPGSQTLFALNHSNDPPDLLGVMVFVRYDTENLVLLHIAVREDYTRAGRFGDAMLVARFVAELRGIARRLRGVKNVILKYSGGLAIPIDPTADPPQPAI